MIHCISMPLLIGILPTIGLSFLEGHAAHRLLAFFVVGFALAAVLPAYLKHRRLPVLIAMIVGVGLVLAATFGAGKAFPENYELPLITIGNLIVVFTHWRNRKLVRPQESPLSETQHA
jgi:peptidoglycan/LPS O-acetylase OafA/YrhL